MLYLIGCLWLLGSVMCYASLVQESMGLGEKVAWTALWPFLTASGVVLGVTLWIYETITGNKVRF